MLDLGLKITLAYLLGSVMGSLWVGRLAGGVDVREEGSGNAGATNALRTRGGGFAVATMLIDVGKGVVAVLLVPHLDTGLAPAELATAWVAVACGAAAVVGHVWPVWHGMRGGKGAATLVGIIAVLAPWALVPVIGLWVLVLVLTGYVGLATILAAWAAPLYFGLMPAHGPTAPLFAFGLAMALFITYTHRSNIQRLRRGEEHRFAKAMLLRRS